MKIFGFEIKRVGRERPGWLGRLLERVGLRKKEPPVPAWQARKTVMVSRPSMISRILGNSESPPREKFTEPAGEDEWTLEEFMETL